jgi:hypothetical protein
MLWQKKLTFLRNQDRRNFGIFQSCSQEGVRWSAEHRIWRRKSSRKPIGVSTTWESQEKNVSKLLLLNFMLGDTPKVMGWSKGVSEVAFDLTSTNKIFGLLPGSHQPARKRNK